MHNIQNLKLRIHCIFLPYNVFKSYKLAPKIYKNINVEFEFKLKLEYVSNRAQAPKLYT